MIAAVAKVFQNGKSQAVRLPKEFRFDTDEVFVEKEGDKVILRPKLKMTWGEYFDNYGSDLDFVLDRPNNGPPQDRDLF
jgi:antitoxin VapB